MINQMSILAQAKPAIISPTGHQQPYSTYQNDLGESGDSLELSDKIQAALKPPQAHTNGPPGPKPEPQDCAQPARRTKSSCPSQARAPPMPHIEDKLLIDKQNASNQMRQASAMVALAASQQQQTKQRLSATERLAMSAKRPVVAAKPQAPLLQRPASPQVVQSQPPPPPPPLPLHQNQQQVKQQPAANVKPVALMPTLETLLAVQRQLQLHTRQNLNSGRPQDLVRTSSSKSEVNSLSQQKAPGSSATATTSTNDKSEASANKKEESRGGERQQQYFSKQFPNLSKFASSAAREQNNYVNSVHETYEKELPPLPASISPSSCTNSSPSASSNCASDESQPNSLELQSSPATSLVSLPPPPPPISSYLQQYDDKVNSAHQQPQHSRQSNSSTPLTNCSGRSTASQVSSIRHLPLVPLVKQQPHRPISSQQAPGAGRPPPPPPPLAPKSQRQLVQVYQHAPAPRPPAELLPELPETFSNPPATQSASPDKGAVAAPPPPSFDEPDCATLRFPTPPPFESLLFAEDEQKESAAERQDEHDLELLLKMRSTGVGFQFPATSRPHVQSGGECKDEEEDFQCRIPTPPSKSMSSFAAFQRQDLNNCHLQHQRSPSLQMSRFSFTPDFQVQPPAPPHEQTPQAQPQHRALFNSSSFLVPTSFASQHNLGGAVQPPPLFRHQEQQQQQVQPPRPPEVQQLQAPEPQLTVCVNNNKQDARLANSNGLLAATNQLGRQSGELASASAAAAAAGRHQQQLMMNTMVASVASSSSPSSSSDGDGHSSNSSSSTSGVHSSIDSPSLKSEQDFNYPPPADGEQQPGFQMAANTMKLLRGAAEPQIMMSSHPIKAPPGHQPQQAQRREAAKKFLLARHENQAHQSAGPRLQAHQRRNSSSSLNSNSTVASANGSVTSSTRAASSKPTGQHKLPRPALKQKKSVSFSDRVEMVACAEEQCEDHLPNPLLARVLAAQKSMQ